MHYSDAAAESALDRPGFSAVMAQPLYELFARRLAAAAPATPRRAARAAAAADQATLAEGPPGHDEPAPMDYDAPGGAFMGDDALPDDAPPSNRHDPDDAGEAFQKAVALPAVCS